MRYFIGIVLALGFLIPGLMIIGAGVGIYADPAKWEDAMAAFVIGGALCFIGIVIYIVARKAHRDRYRTKGDPSVMIATMAAMSLGDNDDASSD